MRNDVFIDPIELKSARPYARALFDYAIEHEAMHKITADFLNFSGLGFVIDNTNVASNGETGTLIFANDDPVDAPKETITVSHHFIKFLAVLRKRNRIDLFTPIQQCYLELVYDSAGIVVAKVSTAYTFTTTQKLNLIKKLKEVTGAREICLDVTVDSSLITGFVITIKSKVVDFSGKRQLENLAKQLGWTQGIENL